MTSITQTEKQVPLKLLVNEETNRVLFAEADTDFVDVLCSFLTLPLGTIARLVRKESSIGAITVGCLNSLYQSVENLGQEYLGNKELLLRPKNSSECYSRTLTLNIDDTERKSYFICGNMTEYNCHRLSTFEKQRCQCGNLLTRQVSVKFFWEGFVKDHSSIVITDDLTLVPTSMDHTIFSLLQNLGVESTHSLKEITVNVTKEKVLDLLKCSLLSKTALTDSFLRKKPLIEPSRFSPCGVEGSSILTQIKINLKLVVRKSDRKILYAQGDEDFAELLLSFLTFPLGAVIRMLGGNCSLGSVDGLFESIADLNANKYFVSEEVKNRLVDPRIDSHLKFSKQILPTIEPRCFCYYERDSFEESFIHDSLYITEEEQKPEEKQDYGGFVQMSLVSPESCAGGATYFVSDDLVVTPVSPISAVYLLDRLETPLSDLEEKAVTIGMKEFLSILRASLTTTSALTNGLCHLLVGKGLLAEKGITEQRH